MGDPKPHSYFGGFHQPAPSAQKRPAGCLCPPFAFQPGSWGRWSLPGGLPLPFDSSKLFPSPLQWVLSFEIFIPLVLFFILLGLRQKKPTIAVKEGKCLAAGRNLESLPRWPRAQSPQVKPVTSGNQASPEDRTEGWRALQLAKYPCPLPELQTKSILSSERLPGN